MDFKDWYKVITEPQFVVKWSAVGILIAGLVFPFNLEIGAVSASIVLFWATMYFTLAAIDAFQWLDCQSF